MVLWGGRRFGLCVCLERVDKQSKRSVWTPVWTLRDSDSAHQTLEGDTVTPPRDDDKGSPKRDSGHVSSRRRIKGCGTFSSAKTMQWRHRKRPPSYYNTCCDTQVPLYVLKDDDLAANIHCEVLCLSVKRSGDTTAAFLHVAGPLLLDSFPLVFLSFAGGCCG